MLLVNSLEYLIQQLPLGTTMTDIVTMNDVKVSLPVLSLEVIHFSSQHRQFLSDVFVLLLVINAKSRHLVRIIKTSLRSHLSFSNCLDNSSMSPQS